MADSPAENLQHVGFLTVVPALLRRLGSDPDAVLAAAGLGSRALDDPGRMISYTAMGRLLQVAVYATQCPHFGLLIGENLGTAALGPLGQLMRHAPTIGVAMRDFATHQHRNSHGSIAYLLADHDPAIFGYTVYPPMQEGHSVLCDAAAMLGLNIVRELARPSTIEGMDVLLSRAEPPDPEPYRRRLCGVKLRFNSDQTAVRLPRKWLSRPIAGADAGQRKALERTMQTLWPVGELDLVTELRRALRVGLLNGQVSSAEISAQLGMHQRTLRRRLRSCGTHFQEVLDETRREFSQQLLACTRLGISEIGLIAGYSDAAAFTRAFIRWSGATPSEWRSSIDPASCGSTDMAMSKAASAD